MRDKDLKSKLAKLTKKQKDDLTSFLKLGSTTSARNSTERSESVSQD